MRRWVEHTGEVELEIEARSEAQVLAEALAGLAELLDDDAPPAGPAGAAEAARYEIRLQAPDRAALLVAWLEELLWIAERDAVVPGRVEALVLDAGGLRAEVVARRTPPRPLVKAVTWHRLRFEPLGEGFRARVVLDV